MSKNRKIVFDTRSIFFFFYILIFMYGFLHLAILLMNNFNNVYMLLTSIVLLISGTVLIVDTLHWLKMCKALKRWLPTSAKVIECEIIRAIDPVHARISPIQEHSEVHIKYEYVYDGEKFVSEVYTPIPRNIIFFDENVLKEHVKEIKKKSELTIYFDKNIPSKASVILECKRERVNELRAYLLLGSILIILGMVSLIFMQKWLSH